MTRIWGDEGRYRLSEISHGDSRDLLSAESLLAPLVPRASCQVTSEVFQPLPQALPSLWFSASNEELPTNHHWLHRIWNLVIWWYHLNHLTILLKRIVQPILQTMARHVAGHVMDLTGVAWHRRLREPSLAAPPRAKETQKESQQRLEIGMKYTYLSCDTHFISFYCHVFSCYTILECCVILFHVAIDNFI